MKHSRKKIVQQKIEVKSAEEFREIYFPKAAMKQRENEVLDSPRQFGESLADASLKIIATELSKK